MTTYDEAVEALSQVEEKAENRGLAKWSGCNKRMLRSIESKGIEAANLSAELGQLSTLLNQDFKGNDLRIFYSKLSKRMLKEYGFTTP